MNEKAPDGQRLVQCFSEQDISKLSKFPKDSKRLKALIDLARKWVRSGCAETPNEAIKMLLEGQP